MNAKKEKPATDKVEEPALSYKTAKANEKEQIQNTFDFDTEFKNGMTSEQFKEEMNKRINTYPWKK